ncbi:cytochrome P450 [Paraconexibacter antarcticus]|uniref:Cytochrome P450 n=1 Tax=Paraconexibacter antarcticus TaxID=2949664 RepID=A0ABY5E172_9ACTN|nr:cytochrome P450 [Paraconexibacter antarcticus]UTI66917.1 cytochrome P450 [Paraconexibacter antarcticus]
MVLPPGPRGPAALLTLAFAARPLDTLVRWHRRYGDVFTVPFLGFGTGVYVADPAAIRDLMTGDQSDLLAGEANSFLTPILGEGSVLVLDGPEHLRQRRLLLPPFQGSRVAGFRALIREVAEREVDTWRPGQRLVLRARMRALTFEIICRAVFGVTDPVRVERLRTALTAVLDSASILLVGETLRRDLGRWSPGGRFARRLRAADALLYAEIAARRRAGDLDEREDVLSLLLRARDEEGRGMTDRELRDELITMLAAGHETTATALAFALELLLRTPGEYDRLRSAVAADGGDARLDAVARETLRLRPVIDAAERTLTRPRRVAGWELPAGVKVYPAIVLVQRRADLYPDPEAFRPERFLEGGVESYAWLPFGGGIRRCVGAALAQAELTEVLRVVVSRAELTPVRAAADPVVLRGITLAPRHGVPVTVTRVGARLPEPALA